MIAVGQEQAEDDLAEKHQLETDTDEPESVEADRDLLRDAQERLELLQRLRDLPDSASIKGQDAVAFLSILTDATHVRVDMERLSVPGLPRDVDWEAFTGWTGCVLWEAANAVAARAGSTPEGLIAIATRRAREQVDRAKDQLRRVVANLDRMRRDRLLPDEVTLRKVIRYESHLNRQFYQALHELEALQGRRRGSRLP